MCLFFLLSFFFRLFFLTLRYALDECFSDVRAHGLSLSYPNPHVAFALAADVHENDFWMDAGNVALLQFKVATEHQPPLWSRSGASLWQGDHAVIDHGVVLGMSTSPDPSRTASSSSAAPASSPAAAGSTIHVANSLDGPWTPLEPNTLGGCNNPAPWVHQNGTIYCLCGSAVLRANSISGPWEHISSLSHSGGLVKHPTQCVN